MIRKGLLVIVLIAMFGVIGSSTLVAQSSMYHFTLNAFVGFEGKVELKWSRPPGDSVRYYLVYRASLPNALAFTRIDSTTSNSKVDMPPTATIPPVYLYYVEAKMKGGSSLRSNTVTVIFYVVPKIDAVRITSEPVKTGRVGTLYTYQVRAVSSDSTAKLKFELPSKPAGMVIDTSGLIKWTPDRKGIFGVFVTVYSSKGGKASQQFYVTVTGPSGTIAGVVTDTTGKPIARVTVRLYGQNTKDHFEYNATTDTLGKYSIAKIDLGTYLARAVPMKGDYLEQWYDGATTTAAAKPIVLKDSIPVTVNFKLKSKVVIPVFSVSGTVTDTSKKPLKNAVVAFTVASFGFNSSRPGSSDWSGDGDNRDLFDLGQAWAMVLGGPSGMSSMGAGMGMGNDGFSDFRLDGNSTYVMKAKTDSLGRYLLKLPQGSYIAQAEASGFYKMFYNNRSDLLSADIIKLTANTENINFALKPILPIAYGKITGSVVDSVSRGGVVSRIIGYRFLVNGKDTLITPRAYVTDTDSVGVYTLANLPPGDYIVLALPLGHFVPSYYSVSGPTREWRKATKVNVNGTTVTGITIHVVPMLRSSTGYSSIRGSVQSSTRPSGALGKVSETVGIEGSLVYAVESSTGQVAGYGVTNTDGSFTIAELAPGTYSVTVDKLDYSSVTTTASPGYDSVTGAAIPATTSALVIDAVVTAVDVDPVLPVEFALEQNYPNPFNPSTQILFALPQAGRISLTIYNLLGQKIVTLVEGTFAAGTHAVTWNGRDARGLQLPSGVYFYSLKTTSFTATKRMILMK